MDLGCDGAVQTQRPRQQHEPAGRMVARVLDSDDQGYAREKLFLVAAGAGLLLGAPSYFVLNRLLLLPPPLRDRPWPFVLAALFAAASAGGAVWRGNHVRRGRAIAYAVLCGLNIAVMTAALLLGGVPPSAPGLPLGTHMPPVTLLDESGSAVDLSKRGSPTLLVVFRGVWCPYCRQELGRLAEQVPRFSSSDIRVFGISADPPEALLRQRQLQKLPFSLLSDPEGTVTAQCAKSMHCLLLFGRDGTLRWGGFSESWRSPVRYEEVLQTAYRL